MHNPKMPFGKGKFSRVKDVSYHQWEDAFAVEFDDGLSFLEPDKTIRAANKIQLQATVNRVELDEELRRGSFCPLRQRPDGGGFLGVHPRTAAVGQQQRLGVPRRRKGWRSP